MASTTPQRQQSRSRRAEVARRAQQRARRPRMLAYGAAAALILAVALGGWWLATRSESPAGAALHTFDTDDVHSLAFDLVDADTLYFGHHGGLQVSRDAGESWQDGPLRGTDAMQQGVALADPPRHYVAGHDVFKVSTDGGQTWQDQPNNLPNLDVHVFAASPADPNRLYAIPAGLGLWRSIDGGVTWTEATLPAGADTQPIALAVAPNDPNKVYLARNGLINTSTDAGQTWQAQPGPAGITTALAVAPDAGESLYAGTNQGLYRREADGSWKQLPVEPDGMIVSVAVSPARLKRVALVDQRGNFYRSDDGGATWAQN